MTSLTERVVDQIRTAITSGGYAPGDRLTETALSREFGVSRVPIREALRTLESEGFVVLRPFAGAAVASLDRAEVSDLFAVREVIETRIFRRCAERFAAATRSRTEPTGSTIVREASRQAWAAETEELLRVGKELDALVSSGERLVAAGETAELPALNTAFHLQVAHASQSASLTVLLRQVAAKIEWVYSRDVETRAASSWQEHRALLNAIVAGEVDAAGILIADHVGKARRAHFKETFDASP